jgi:hypothetical protein
MTEPEGAAEASALIVVRVGALDRFAALRETFAAEDVDVVWDRRLGGRRRPRADGPPVLERRRRERRGPAPPSWALLDFLVVPGGPRAS